MNTGVYQIKNLINNHSYIGSTSNRGFIKRRLEHFNHLKNKIHHSTILQNAWNKYKSENFIFGILEECKPEKCIEREQFYLNNIKPEYNIRRIAESNFGLKHSNKVKKKMSELKQGNKNPFYGKKHSDSTKLKISQFLIGNKYRAGKKCSKITCEKISKGLKGHSCSDETKQKLRNKNIGNKNPNYGKSPSLETKHKISLSLSGIKNVNFSGFYKFKNIVTKNIVVLSKKDISVKYSLDRSAVSKICNHTLKSHKNWICLGKI